VTIRTDALQEDVIDDSAPLYLIIYGQHEHSKKLALKDGLTGDMKRAFGKDGEADLEFKSQDVGKVSDHRLGIV
jgi:hypothetical protein